jgi:uncharacterized protein YjiS (DUF1127 family)
MTDATKLACTPSNPGWSSFPNRVESQRLFWGARFWHWCARCSARSRQRQALSTLDDRLLDDIGVTQQEANAEVAKPFWR